MGLYAKYGDFVQAHEEVQKINARKRSNVSATMTLSNRLYLLIQEDQYNTFADYDSEIYDYGQEKMDAAEIERLRQSKKYRTGADLVALHQDPLSKAEIEVRQADGRIPNRASRDKSLEYRQCLKDYTEKNGKVNRQARLKFQRLRKEIVIRVLQETNCVFATCNIAGSEIMHLRFSPNLSILMKPDNLPYWLLQTS